MNESTDRRQKIVHVGFELGLLLKGLDGLLEIMGGIFLNFLNPERLNRVVRLLTQHELSEDPRDMAANFLVTLSSGFSVSAQQFGVVYLLSHGIIKCVLVFLLWRRKLWAYPLTIFSLLLFIVYQVYRYTLNPSAFLVVLTVFDAVMIVLTYLEYKRIHSALSA